jgi:hypothetical protein
MECKRKKMNKRMDERSDFGFMEKILEELLWKFGIVLRNLRQMHAFYVLLKKKTL